MIPWLTADAPFPSVDTALDHPNGLLAAGADLSPQRLLDALQHGIFPWFSEGDPLLWWSPDPRTVLPPSQMKISRSLKKTLRNGDYVVLLDSAFDDVIAACAKTSRPDQDGTWITPSMQSAYRQLHYLGYAHSVETWCGEQLVGGLYGVALGDVFFGESMFSLQRDASKIALAHLCLYLSQREFGIIDCQMPTKHLTSLGAREIARDQFVAIIARLTAAPRPPRVWSRCAVLDAFRRPPGRPLAE